MKSQENKLIIGVADCSKFINYSNWMSDGPDEIEVVKLSCEDGNFNAVKRCHGVLLTGGEDVHPRFYNKPEYLAYCHKDDVREARDQFELELLSYTEQNAVPVLGICRGLQLANVFFGGSLIPDIPSWGKFSHAKLADGKDRYHSIQIDPASMLRKIIQQKAGFINSNHHQSADKVGEELVVTALSPDGVVEALERKDAASKSFLCLVQWHPERMEDQLSAFTINIKNAFLDAAKMNKTCK
ncbi:gamma-glutamyl-gamma-aminobutyrate hydrolase family protein [Solitalea koreensis]|uniref:Putative glutamine amidotransferase n=1 Tax=Solitalea koreensis TaxID=543615 RepID=A0A521ATH1_9SPHI|nr:gamma-glutamyl-gamma-aminobutyrate hydrolase family protein [Solitalea koreensis]SMO38031.1 putative glutamine amidotransferase [Solitalea koreensis]